MMLWGKWNSVQVAKRYIDQAPQVKLDAAGFLDLSALKQSDAILLEEHEIKSNTSTISGHKRKHKEISRYNDNMDTEEEKSGESESESDIDIKPKKKKRKKGKKTKKKKVSKKKKESKKKKGKKKKRKKLEYLIEQLMNDTSSDSD